MLQILYVGRYCKHPYFIQTPPMCNLAAGSQYGDMYTSLHSGRVMSAKPMSRMSALSKFHVESQCTNNEASTATYQRTIDNPDYNRQMIAVQSEQNLRPCTAPTQEHNKYKKKNRKILSGNNPRKQ